MIRALEALSESLAAKLAPFGVRVLIVEPATFRTRLFGAAFRTKPEGDGLPPSARRMPLEASHAEPSNSTESGDVVPASSREARPAW